MVNHIIERRGSEFYGFIYKIFTRQFCLQKFRKKLPNIHKVMACIMCQLALLGLKGYEVEPCFPPISSVNTILFSCWGYLAKVYAETGLSGYCLKHLWTNYIKNIYVVLSRILSPKHIDYNDVSIC